MDRRRLYSTIGSQPTALSARNRNCRARNHNCAVVLEATAAVRGSGPPGRPPQRRFVGWHGSQPTAGPATIIARPCLLCMAHNWSPTRPPWLCQRCSTSSKSRPPMPPQSSGRRPDLRRPRVYLSFVLWPDLHMHWASASINNLFFGSLPVADFYLTLSSLPKTLPPLSPSHRTKAAVLFRHELQFRFVAGQCQKMRLQL